jgi:SecD/SecF fusion protein
MSVDANVLIYERIREELRNGKGLSLAISDGYNSAYSSIIDANVTTLLTGIILYTFSLAVISSRINIYGAQINIAGLLLVLLFID